MNDIKNSFERGMRLTCDEMPAAVGLKSAHISVERNIFPGNDPLTDDEDNHDMNSVAGVLKLYFRGLENPLFPKERFNDLLSCISEFSCVFTFSVNFKIRTLVGKMD